MIITKLLHKLAARAAICLAVALSACGAAAQVANPVNVLVQCAAPGTASFTGCSSVTGRNTLAAVPTGRLVQYFAIAVNASTGAPTGGWESGWGAWSGTALTRNVYTSTNANALVAFGADTYVMLADQGGYRLQPTDLLAANATAMDPFVGAAISAGTLSTTTLTGQTGHPGIVRLRNGTTANGGYRIQTDAAGQLLAAGDVFAAVLRIDALTNNTIRVGYHDSVTSADAVDGVYIEIAATGVASCKASNNSTRTTSATTATLSAATWYRASIVVESASLARCIITNDAGTDVLNTTVTSNIPTAAGREVGAGIVATNSGTVASDIVQVDYMMVGSLRALARAAQ